MTMNWGHQVLDFFGKRVYNISDGGETYRKRKRQTA